MSVDRPQNKALVFDTDAYAGNFEREMCAYLTGRYGECEVGKGIALAVRPMLRHFADWYEEKVVSEPDEHGCWRPVSIWPSPKVEGVPEAYNSVAIFVEDFPPAEVLTELVARAQAFCHSSARWGSRPGAILGLRTIEPAYRVEERGLLDAAGLDRSGCAIQGPVSDLGERVLVLADFSNLAYRVNSTVSMAPHPMVRRALLRARDVARAVGATDLAFAFDPDPVPSPLYAGTAEEARTPRARALLRSMGYPCYQEPDLSADDLLIALARAAEQVGFGRVVVASHDMDLLAAVSEVTALWRPMTAKGKLLRFDVWNADRIRARFGVAPTLLGDLRVLGCRPYLGATHAILDGRSSRRLLRQYGSLLELYAHLDEIEPAGLRERLASQESFAHERLAVIRAIEGWAVTFEPEAGRLGQVGVQAIDPGLVGLESAAFLLGEDGPRLAALAAL